MKIFTDSFIQELEPADKKYTVSCGHGLAIQVLPTGAKKWIVRYRTQYRYTYVPIGYYPQVQIDEAYDQAKRVLLLVSQGVNPKETPPGAHC